MEIWSATVDAFTLLASGDAALWLIVWVSLKVAIAGLLLAAPPGLLIAYLIAMHRFMGRRALVVLAEAEVPKAMAEAFRSGNMGIMDYYKMKNVQADTSMRESIARPDDGK